MSVQRIVFLKLREMGYRTREIHYPTYVHIRKLLDPVVRILHRRLARENQINPTHTMYEAQCFFKKNHHRIKNIKTFLEDEESRIVFDTMIQFRCTQDYSILNRISEINVHRQYFDNEFFCYDKQFECLIDCGAFDGDTVNAFRHHMSKIGVREIKVVAFEPDKSNYIRLVKNQPRITAINSGVWNKDTTLSFIVKGNASTKTVIDEKDLRGTTDKQLKISVRSIDNCRECDDATLIKMDVEGSEKNGLEGAKNLIIRKKPKLAICIYHSNEDMLQIAEWVHEAVPEYRIWIRQHMDNNNETVLYAMV